jgi:hypothetical protein
MALTCEKHTAFLFDRGGRRKLASLDDLQRVKWGRKRDDPSTATVYVGSPGIECQKALELAETNRVELVIFRGADRVWEGPLTRISYRGASVEIEARDVMVYLQRTAMRNEYDNRYPNNTLVLDRVKRIMTAELARKEALDPPVNVLAHVQYLYENSPDVSDAGTAARTYPMQYTVFEHIDNYAAKGGLDYTVVGRSILLFDVHHRIGQTPMVGADDFIGDIVITQYGMELATYVAMTDGKGNWGAAGYEEDGVLTGVNPYYGEWEVLHQAYDEETASTDPEDIPSVAELESQAQRSYKQAEKPPLVARVPDNTRLNPDGVLTIDMLVPGTWVPLSASLPGRTVQQMQKLDSMTVEETAGKGEEIKVTLSPAYTDTFVEDETE